MFGQRFEFCWNYVFGNLACNLVLVQPVYEIMVQKRIPQHRLHMTSLFPRAGTPEGKSPAGPARDRDLDCDGLRRPKANSRDDCTDNVAINCAAYRGAKYKQACGLGFSALCSWTPRGVNNSQLRQGLCVAQPANAAKPYSASFARLSWLFRWSALRD